MLQWKILTTVHDSANMAGILRIKGNMKNLFPGLVSVTDIIDRSFIQYSSQSKFSGFHPVTETTTISDWITHETRIERRLS